MGSQQDWLCKRVRVVEGRVEVFWILRLVTELDLLFLPFSWLSFLLWSWFSKFSSKLSLCCMLRLTLLFLLFQLPNFVCLEFLIMFLQCQLQQSCCVVLKSMAQRLLLLGVARGNCQMHLGFVGNVSHPPSCNSIESSAFLSRLSLCHIILAGSCSV